MPSAVIVCGSEKLFEEGKGFQTSLLTSLGFKGVRAVLARRTPKSRFEERLTGAVHRAADNDPLVIAYSGHGDGADWMPYTGFPLAYAHLVSLVARRTAPTLFINDCCDSWVLAEVLEEAGADGRRVGAITSTHKTPCDSFDTALLSRIAGVWTTGKPFEAGGVMRFAVEGDDRSTAMGSYMPKFRFMEVWKAVFTEGKRIHTQRSARWGAVNDRAFFSAASP